MTRFQAVLFIIGKPTPQGIAGSKGRRVKMAQSAIDKALCDLPGKPLWRSRCLATHDCTNQIGVIGSAFVVGDMFCINGEIFGPEMVDLAACDEPLGISYDANNCWIRNPRDREIWEVTDGDFLGATVLRQKKSGHKDLCLFWLEAA